MGWMGPQGGKRVSSGGAGAGRRPFLVRPDSPAPFGRPGGKRAPAAHGHREAGALALARAAREEAAPDPFGRIEAIHDRAGTHSAAAGSRTPASTACRRRSMSGGPSPARDPCDDAAIEPANGAPKKGLAYRRASAGLGRLRREPDPCVRRRSGAGTHSARGCMGPAEFGNAGLSPWKTLSWPSRIRRRLGRALLPGDLGDAVAVGAAAPDL